MQILLPTRSFDKTHHVNMRAKGKRWYNHESRLGLSVTPERDDPHQINKGMAFGECSTLSKPGGLFIDVNAIDVLSWVQLYLWGIEEGYLVRGERYEFTIGNPDTEQEKRLSFDTYQEAEANAEGRCVTCNPCIKSTQKMHSLMGNKNAQDSSLIVLVYAHHMQQWDGVYWDDKLDIENGKRPHVTLLQTHLGTWSIEGAVASKKRA